MIDEISMQKNLSANTCSHCGGPAPRWKCPMCGVEADTFDPMHWRNCAKDGKMQPLCEGCGNAEANCTCAVS